MRCKAKLGIIAVNAKGSELGKAVRGIGRGAKQETKTEGFWFNTGEDVKGMGGDNVREARDYGNAVPSVRSLEEGIGIG